MNASVTVPARWWTRPLSLALLGCAITLMGCSDDQTNPIKGNVTFDGQPVPAGKIYFTPDSSKQNTGSQGFAAIDNGQYDSTDGGQGVAPGAYIVRIEGFDGESTDKLPMGKPLFRYEVAKDIPEGAATVDFEVPADAAKNLPKQEEGIDP